PGTAAEGFSRSRTLPQALSALLGGPSAKCPAKATRRGRAGGDRSLVPPKEYRDCSQRFQQGALKERVGTGCGGSLATPATRRGFVAQVARLPLPAGGE